MTAIQDVYRPAAADCLPADVQSYRRTDEFTEFSVPRGLLQAHSTKPGVWGLIHVAEGELVYTVVDERRSPTERRLTPSNDPGLVEPTIVHQVRPVNNVRFFVEFFR